MRWPRFTERGYPVAEVSQRLGVSQHSLYSLKRQLAKQLSGDAGTDAEVRHLAGGESDYRMAGTKDQAILQHAQDMSDGPALDAAAEERAMALNWLY